MVLLRSNGDGAANRIDAERSLFVVLLTIFDRRCNPITLGVPEIVCLSLTTARPFRSMLCRGLNIVYQFIGEKHVTRQRIRPH